MRSVSNHLRNDGHLLAQVVEAKVRGQNAVDVDFPARFCQAEQSRDQRAFPGSGSSDDPQLEQHHLEKETGIIGLM